MSAGSFAAGSTPAGYDSVYASVGKVRRLPQALYFDLATADFPIDANGFYKSVHPVDQRVALSLGVLEGTLASVPELGQRLRRITRISPTRAKRAVEDVIDLALDDLIEAGDIRLERVEVDTSIRGRTLVAVNYVNLRLLPLQSRTERKVLYR